MKEILAGVGAIALLFVFFIAVGSVYFFLRKGFQSYALWSSADALGTGFILSFVLGFGLTLSWLIGNMILGEK